MTFNEQGGISETFYTYDRKFAFQRIGNYWRLYGGELLTFLQEFRSFASMHEYIMNARLKEA